jgi:hypothetical protein
MNILSITKTSSGLILLALSLVAISACNKVSNLGISIVGDSPFDNFITDTISFSIKTVAGDSVLSSNKTSSKRFYVGTWNSPELGTLKAGAALSFSLKSVSPDFTGATLDSVVLTMPYAYGNHYGDPFVPQSFEIVELTQKLSTSTTYYSQANLSTGNVLANATFSINPASATKEIRIPLSNTLGATLLNPNNKNFLISNTALTDLFKGLVIRPTNNAGTGLFCLEPSINLVDITKSNASIQVYYQQAGTQKTFVLTHDRQSSSRGVGLYKFDRTNATALNNTDSLLYLQSLGGYDLKVDFPYIDKLKDIIVNKAELTLFIPFKNDIRLQPEPNILQVAYKTSTGTWAQTYNSLSSSGNNNTFGARESYSNGRVQGFRYRINLSYHFQRMIEGKLDNAPIEKTIYIRASDLELIGTQSAISPTLDPYTWASNLANKVALGSQKATVNKPKLVITYSKIK